MKKRIVGAFSLLAIVIGGLTFAVQSQSEAKPAAAYYSPSTHYEVSDTASELASYYSSISDSDSGTSLLSKLQSLNSSKRKKTMGYSTIGTDTSGAVIYTDYDLNSTAKDSNGQTYGTKVASFYTKTAATSWNREHMWPNSHGGNNVEADILHTRPTISSENSSRGNSFYVEGKNNSSSGWDPYTAGYAEWCRGECARVILYCVVAYPSFTLSDADSHSTSNSNKDNMMGNMNTLIKWHFNYLPNVYEKNRNDGAEYLQGNRNPFVDHPEYVARIWSNFNSTVSSLCSSNSTTYSNWVPGNYCNFGSNTPVQAADGVTISKTTASVSVGSTTTISATSTDSGTISWTTSNSSVASLSSSSSASGANITVTGVSAGTATITAKRTISGTQYSQTCTVTVTKVVSSLSKGSTSPTKTTYTAGESFDPTGLTITATYSDSTQENVTSQVAWTPDPLTAGTTSVTGTFGGKTITISGLTVNEAAIDSYSIVPADLANGTYPTSATSYTASSGIKVTACNTANFSSKIQFKKSGGYLYNDSSLNLGTVTLSGVSGTLTVYAGTTKNPSSTTISGSNGAYDLSGYNYFKIINNSGSVATCSSITVGIAQEAKTLSSISVSTAPTKTTYTAGEYFDPTGLVITRTYSDSTSDTYTYANHTSEFTFSPTTSTALTTGNTSVTISYGGKSCSQAITVNAAKTLSSIAVSTAPTKTTYTAGEYFDPTGLVIRRNYSDSTYDTYTYANHTGEFTFSPTTSTALTTSNASVTITYSGKSCNQAITVNVAAKTLSSISVSGYKAAFTIDDTFSFGGTVTAHFSDSSTSDVTASATFTGYNMSQAGNQTVTVSYTYGGTTKTTTYNITVSASGGGSQTEDNPETITMSEQGFTSGQDATTATGTNVTVTFAKNGGNNSPKYYDSGTAVRVYPNNTITVASQSLTIIKITITFGSSDGSNSITSSPSGWSSPDWTGSANSVVFTIGGSNGHRRISAITVYYEESGSTDPVTSISATVSKTFYVGETISTSDITVKDNNNKTVTGFSFANNGYQFAYSDAASGGAATSKTFTNSVTYESLTCSLTVQVQRKAYVAPSSSSLEHTGSEFSSAGISAGGSASYFEENQTATVDGVTFNVSGYVFTNTSPVALSFSESKNSATGSLTNTTPYPGCITNVTVSGASPDVQLSTDGSNWVDLSSATPTTVDYYYLKVFFKNTSQSNYINITSFTVSLDGRQTPTNVANYVMYEDTNNQCTTKFDVAKSYFEGMSAYGRATFMTSNDYVISTGRERLQAWAKHEGKSIVSQNGDYVITTASRISILGAKDNNASLIIVVAIVSVSFVSILGFYILKKRKVQ